MNANWEMAKNKCIEEYIEKYFGDDVQLIELTENAFNGELYAQEYLVEYFHAKGNLVEENKWKQKADMNRLMERLY